LLAAKIIETAFDTIRKRSLPEGGFANYCGELFRPDVTAWAVLALKAGQKDQKVSTFACQRLALRQNPDGRISVIDGLLQLKVQATGEMLFLF
jgi:hypothetical protein